MEEFEFIISLRDLATPTLASIARSINPLPSAVQKVEKAWQGVNTQLAKVAQTGRNFLTNFNDRMDKFSRGLENRFQGFEILGNTIERAIQPVNDVTQKYAQMSDTLAIVQKNTNLSTDEMKDLRASIEDMNTRTATNSLLNVATVAGKMGVPKAEIQDFVQVVDMANVALGDEFGNNAEVVATGLAKIKGQFADTQALTYADALTKIGSAVNAVGKAGANSAPNVVDFAQRVSALGLSTAEAIGLGATLEALGTSAEIGASGLKAIFAQTASNADKFAQQLGMTVQEFENLRNNSPNDVIVRLAESLKGASAIEVDRTLQSLGIRSQESSDVIKKLSGNLDELARIQGIAGEQMMKGTDLQGEFNIMNNTTAAQLDKMKKRFESVAVSMGEYIAPFAPALQATSQFAITFSALIPLFSLIASPVGLVVAGIVSLGVAMYYASTMSDVVKNNFILLWQELQNTFSIISNDLLAVFGELSQTLGYSGDTAITWRDVFIGVMTYLSGAIRTQVLFISTTIMGIAQALRVVTAGFQTIIGFWVNIFQAGWALITGDIDGFKEHFFSAFSGIRDFVFTVIDSITKTFGSMFKTISSGLQTFGVLSQDAVSKAGGSTASLAGLANTFLGEDAVKKLTGGGVNTGVAEGGVVSKLPLPDVQGLGSNLNQAFSSVAPVASLPATPSASSDDSGVKFQNAGQKVFNFTIEELTLIKENVINQVEAGEVEDLGRLIEEKLLESINSFQVIAEREG